MLRQGRRRPRVDVDDAGPELDALGALGEQGEDAEGVAPPGLGHPDRVDPDAVGDLDAPEQAVAIGEVLPVERDADATCHENSFGTGGRALPPYEGAPGLTTGSWRGKG